MALAQQVAALRAFFGVRDEVPLLQAVEDMNLAMGIVAEGLLPQHVNTLCATTGIGIEAPPRAAPVVPTGKAPAAAAATAAAAAATEQLPAALTPEGDVFGCGDVRGGTFDP